MNVTCVVLAAGTGRRCGGTKLVSLVSGTTLVQRAVDACGRFACTIVVGPALLDTPELRSTIASRAVDVLINDDASRGMSHSLRLANAALDSAITIAVIPADLPLLEAHHVESIVLHALDVDVTYPLDQDGVGGHPVLFSPHARHGIATLPDGDMIRLVRDDPKLRRCVIPTNEYWPTLDVDVTADISRAEDFQRAQVAKTGLHHDSGPRSFLLAKTAAQLLDLDGLPAPQSRWR